MYIVYLTFYSGTSCKRGILSCMRGFSNSNLTEEPIGRGGHSGRFHCSVRFNI